MTPDERRRLRTALAALYETVADVRRVAEDAGLQVEQIDIHGSVVTCWSNVLAEARKQHALPALLAVARREYPHDAELAAVETFAQTTDTGVSTERPEAVVATLEGRRQSPRARALSREACEHLAALVAEVLDPSVRASATLAKVLAFATKHRLTDLAKFCGDELTGWDGPSGPVFDVSTCSAKHRLIECFVSTTHEVNLSYFGWSGNMQNAIEYMRASREFTQTNIFYSRPLLQVEADQSQGDAQKNLMVLSVPTKALPSGAKDPASVVRAYCRGDSLSRVVTQVRTTTAGMLTKMIALEEGAADVPQASPHPHVSANEGTVPMPSSTTDEFVLYEALVGLLSGQFEEVLLRMAIPIHYLPAQTAAPSERAMALVRLLRQGGRLAELSKALFVAQRRE